MKKNLKNLFISPGLLIPLLLISLATFGCSAFSNDEITPESKMAVLRVCDEYLRDLATGRSNQAETMIAWSDYKPATDDGLTRAEFTEIVKSKKDIWSKEENPLLGLDVLDTDIGGDTATVELVKKSTGTTIELKLNWIGRGWVIVGDNILSKGGVFGKS